MEEYKGLTISEFIEILKRFPQDAKIGTCDYDSEELCMYAGNNITVSDFNDISDELRGFEEERCDYYIW